MSVCPWRLASFGLLSAVLLGLVAVPQVVAGKGNQGNSAVVPPQARFRGQTYSEWQAGFWQSAFATPVVDGDHPFFSGGVLDGEKNVAYLAAPFGDDTQIHVTVKPGTALFIPILTVECSQIEDFPFHGDDEAEMRFWSNAWIDHSWGHYAVVDGVPVNNIDAYRSESPLFEFGPVPADNIYGFPEGSTSQSVAAGHYILLAPLSVGQHEVNVGAGVTWDDFELDFSFNTTFHITVQP